MRALVFEEAPAFQTAYPRAAPLRGEAVVRVKKAGICSTDLELIRGYKGFAGILGHEFVGVLHELPSEPAGGSFTSSGSELAVGTRVVAEINCVPFGSLSRTAAERAQHPERTTLGINRHHGAFADFVNVPLENLHRVPDSVSDDEAVFVEPLAAACQILEAVPIRPTDRVYVLGDGKLGLLCAQVLASVPCELVALGKHESKLALLKKRGIKTVLAAGVTGLAAADIVVECTGSPAGFELAMQLLRPRGTLVLKSTYASSPSLAPLLSRNDLAAVLTKIVVDELMIVGSRCGPFSAALRLLEQHRVEVLPMIAARYPLEEGVLALQRAREKGVLKVLLEMTE